MDRTILSFYFIIYIYIYIYIYERERERERTGLKMLEFKACKHESKQVGV